MFSLTNELEQSLLLAMTDHQLLPDFYQTLLQSNVHIYAQFAEKPGNSEGVEQIPSGQNIVIQHWDAGDGNYVIPFFTSPDMLMNSHGGGEHAMDMASKMLFSLAQTVPMVMNPGSAFERYFSPEEIRSLLITGSPDVMQDGVLEAEHEFEFSDIKEKPDALVTSLTDEFNDNGLVERAWMVSYQFSENEGANPIHPRLMVGIEFVDDKPDDMLVSQLSIIASQSMSDNVYSHVDFLIVVTGESEISDYLIAEIEPFYQRKKKKIKSKTKTKTKK